MKPNQTVNETFSLLVELPEFLIPWADRFYKAQEIELISIMNRDTLDAASVQVRGASEPDSSCPQEIESLMKRSFKRGVLNQDDRLYYSVADFHARYDIWALFESWQDIPDAVRDQLNGWEVNFYQDQHRALVEGLRRNHPRDTTECWPEYLLLCEAAALIDAVKHVYLWPCSCRAMIDNCKKPIYTSLRFSNKRGNGWEISKTRASILAPSVFCRLPFSSHPAICQVSGALPYVLWLLAFNPAPHPSWPICSGR